MRIKTVRPIDSSSETWFDQLEHMSDAREDLRAKTGGLSWRDVGWTGVDGNSKTSTAGLLVVTGTGLSTAGCGDRRCRGENGVGTVTLFTEFYTSESVASGCTELITDGRGKIVDGIDGLRLESTHCDYV